METVTGTRKVRTALKGYKGPKAKTLKDKQQDREISRLKKIVNTRELKYFDQALTNLVPTWNGSVVNIFAPAEGDTDNARTGDQVAIERMEFRLNGGMTAAGSNQLRVMIIRDKGNSIGTTPGNIVDSQALATANAAQGPLEEDFRKNFEVLYDKTVMLDSVNHYQIQLKYNKRWKVPKKVTFQANSTTVTSGQIKLVLIGDLLLPNIALDYYSRIWFSDL